MVQLIIFSPKGNQGIRYFPYTGYLGLTPLKVEGVVCTKLDADLRPLLATSITVSVRCYEARMGRVNAISSNVLYDNTQVLWTKPEGQHSGEVGNSEHSFRIMLPENVTGFGMVSYQDYRVYWRVEAVINHVPIAGVGSRQRKHFDLPLVRYDVPPSLPDLPSSSRGFTHTSSKPNTPTINYRIDAPRRAVGPLEDVRVPVHFQIEDRSASIRSASLIVERRIVINDAHGSRQKSPTLPSLTQTPSVPIPGSSLSTPTGLSKSYHESTRNLLTCQTSTRPSTRPPSPTFSEDPLILPPLPCYTPPSPSSDHGKTTTTPIVGTESLERFVCDELHGVCSQVLSFRWPVARSNSRWAIGESIQSDLVSVKFFLRVKIVVSSSMGTESIELAEQEMMVTLTSEADRKLALAKYHERPQSARARSKSKSPKRARIESMRPTSPPGIPGGSDLVQPSTRAAKPVRSEKPRLPSQSSFAKKTRIQRPHTSAGLKAKDQNLAGVYDDELHKGVLSSRPATSDRGMSSSVESRLVKKRSFSQRWLVAPKMSGTSSANTSASSATTSSGSQGVDPAQIRAWENELERMESQSRRGSSGLLGFASFWRKRTTELPSRIVA